MRVLLVMILFMLVNGCAHTMFKSGHGSKYIQEYEDLRALYAEYLGFKDNEDFIRDGFVEGTEYMRWIQQVQELQKQPGYSPDGPRMLTILSMAYRQEGKDSVLVQQIAPKFEELLANARIERSSSIVVLYTGDTSGTLKPLMVDGWQVGGLARRAPVVDHVRDREDHVLLVDSGDAFVVGDSNKKTNEILVDVMNRMKYDVMGLGPLDFAVGEEQLKALIARAEFPMICTNLVFENEVEAWIKPYAILDAAGLRVAVLSVVPDDSEVTLQGVRFVSARESLEKYFEQLAVEADSIILLTQYDAAKISTMLRAEDPLVVVFADSSSNPLNKPKYIFPAVANSQGIGFFRMVKTNRDFLEPAFQSLIPLSGPEVDVKVQQMINAVH